MLIGAGTGGGSGEAAAGGAGRKRPAEAGGRPTADVAKGGRWRTSRGEPGSGCQGGVVAGVKGGGGGAAHDPAAAAAARPAGRRPRLADVAARAGVSSGLVSLVLRNQPGPSAPTRARVIAAAQELGYRADRMA